MDPALVVRETRDSNLYIPISQVSKRSAVELYGRNDANIKVIIPAFFETPDGQSAPIMAGDFVRCRITAANSQVLKALPLYATNL